MASLLKRRRTGKEANAVTPETLDSLERLGLPWAEEMTLEDFFDIPDCPRQRNTEKRAARAKHLDRLFPTHTVVVIARFPDGSSMRLDGHTRLYKWANGKGALPDRLLAIVLPVDNLTQALAYYTHFDNKAATEQVHEKICGAIKQFNLEIASAFIGDGRIGTPLRYVSRALRIAGVEGIPAQNDDEFVYTVVSLLTPQIEAMDALNLKASKFRGPLATALILAHIKHGDKILPFFKAVDAGAGAEIDGRACPLAAVKNIMSNTSGGGQSEHMARAGRVLRCVERWLKKNGRGPCYRGLPRELDAYGYLESKRVDDEGDDE